MRRVERRVTLSREATCSPQVRSAQRETVPRTDALPEPLEAALVACDGGGEEVVIAVAADLHRGGFGEEWLVVTRDRLLVFAPNGARPTPRLDLPIASLKSVSTDSLVGGAALYATIGGETVELVRYTNARQNRFHRVAKYLEEIATYHQALARGEEVKETPRLAAETEEEKRCSKCRLLLPEGSKVCPACMSKGRVIARLLSYLQAYRGQMVLLCLMVLMSTALGLIAPYLTRPLMDVVIAPRGVPLPARERLTWLGMIVLGMAGAQLAAQAISAVQGRTAASLTHKLSHGLRMELYQHLQLLSLRFFDKRQVGQLISRVTHDTSELQPILTIGVQFYLANLLMVVGIGIVLCSINGLLFLLAVLPAPLVAGLSKLFWKRISTAWQRWWHFNGRLTAVLNDNLSGVRVVKAFAQEAREIARFDPRSSELAEAGRTAEATWMTVFPILSFVTGTGGLLVWYVGGRQAVAGAVTLGTLMTFVAYLGMFYGPLQFLNRVAEWLSRALASAERVFEILDSEPDVREAEDAVAMPRIEGRVAFRDVTFGYDPHKPVLKHVDLDVRPGEMIGFVGHSGAGKSTMINLICRFYDVNEGQILIDGVEIRKIRQQDLRSQIGVVLQDTFLFNGTIAENIRYAKPDATVEEILAAARAANAHDFIVQKPDGYDTQVGERGQSLSGGERQRIAIARAILHNPRILILDEATSAVDTDTEKQIQDAIARLIRGRTTFAIAHRLSTLRNADRLVVLKDGKVAEVGTHDELLEKKGEFHRLVEMQQEMSKIKALSR
jgi:ATP-binding cassette subfamily B protein